MSIKSLLNKWFHRVELEDFAGMKETPRWQDQLRERSDIEPKSINTLSKKETGVNAYHPIPEVERSSAWDGKLLNRSDYPPIVLDGGQYVCSVTAWPVGWYNGVIVTEMEPT